MLLGYAQLFEADDTERALPDADSARRLLDQHQWLARVDALLSALQVEDARVRDAFTLGLARLGHRHGGFGTDPHHYHNESHVMELAERRLPQLRAHLGIEALPAEDWTALLLFAACHDLRQRETGDVPGPVGGNEAASVAEAVRLLTACGFDCAGDAALFTALELMIAGSTFNAGLDADLRLESSPVLGGCFARSLGAWLDQDHPGWREDADARRGERLARLAADLDTANVGEAFDFLADSAERLCREREMRAGQAIDKAISAPTSLGFLSRGQLRYFFDLHRFASREGEKVFGPIKAANAAKVREVSAALLAHFHDHPPASGEAVITAFRRLCAA